MKYRHLKSLLAVGAGSLLLVGTSCNKLEDFGDTNVNPLGSTTPITSALLTNVESQLGGFASVIRPALYVQYVAETQYTDASLYAEPKLEFGGNYSGPLYDLQSIIDRNSNPATAGKFALSGSAANQIAVSKILKSYLISTVTDRWGDVPYEESLKAAGNFTPKFDMQLDIYKKMFADLKDAVDGFDGGLKMQGDIMYAGDQAKWKKLANTLRMQLALRLSKRYPAPGGLAAMEFAAAAAHPAGFIATNADNFTLNYPGGAAYRHPWFNTYNGRSDYALSKTLTDILSNLGDARRSAYGTSDAAFPYGLKRDQALTVNPSYAKVLADSKRTESSPVVVVSAASSLLAVAEGLERGWITSTINPAYASAKTAYEDAIKASFDQWGIAGGAAYAVSGPVAFNSGAGGGTGVGVNSFGSIPASSNAVTTTSLQRIHLQRYIALFPDGIQAWNSWRRTGIPDIKPTAFATNSAAGFTIPRRYVYGTNEYSLNPAALAEAVGRLTGGDVMSARVWWDQQ